MNNANLLYVASLLLILEACSDHGQLNVKPAKQGSVTEKQAVIQDKYPEPVFGYRFTITGDFNGDGKNEKLTEHYYSEREHRETNKFYSNVDDYGDQVKLAGAKKANSFVKSSDKLITDLQIDKGGSFGLAYLKNEGDLDNDGGDEISYVINKADWSNLNTWNIVSFKKGKWKPVYHFPVWDWQLPALPAVIEKRGMFGREDLTPNSKNSPEYKASVETLKKFKGLVKKTGNGKIRVIFMNNEAVLDTAIIDLKKQKPAY